MPDHNDSDVVNFYNGKSVLVTGGTGFLGKTLIEKLLYTCTGIEKIYVLVRDKNGQQVHDRINKMINTAAFDRLKISRSKDLDKIIPVSGDCSCKDLGLANDVSRTLEEEVSVVFHLAATVHFNLPLKHALNINVDGTHEVIKLCRRLKKMQALVHVSTAFSNVDRSNIGEVVYPLHVSLEHAKREADLYPNDEELMNNLKGNKPNTYTLSKAFAEEMIKNECTDIPAAIVRPSIVISSLREPNPGWVDSWNGSSGIFVGIFTGTLKISKGLGTNILDLIPVDIVTNLLIVVATECQKSKDVKVYNCCTGNSNSITYDEASVISSKVALKYSLNDMPWPYTIFTPSVIFFNIVTFLLQVLPAYLIDLFSILTGKQAIQIKVQQKLRNTVELLKYFLLREWKFDDDNMKNLFKSLSDVDKKLFDFDVKNISWESCIQDYIFGCRKYLLKRNDIHVSKRLLK